MKTVSNIEELTVEIISQFADMFEKEFAPYSYKMTDECINILNHENVVVLSITNDSVIIKDIIQDAIESALYEEILKIKAEEANTLLSVYETIYDKFSLEYRFMHDQLMNVVAKPEPNFKTFKYFKTEEQWFQQSTVHQDVLPYETAVNINRIKKSVIKDLTEQWIA